MDTGIVVVVAVVLAAVLELWDMLAVRGVA